MAAAAKKATKAPVPAKKKPVPAKTTKRAPLARKPAAGKAARTKGTSAADAMAATLPLPAPPPAERPSQGEPIGVELPIGSISPSPLNPRKVFDPDTLCDLAQSIKTTTLLQPIVVRPQTDADRRFAFEQNRPLFGQYLIVAGERRWRAISMLVRDGAWPESKRVPARIVDVTEQQALLMAATENLSRDDMHPLEEGAVFSALRATGMVDAEIAKHVGISVRTVRRRTQLMRLCDEADALFRAKRLQKQQAEALSMGSPAMQREHFKLYAKPDTDFVTDYRWEPDFIRDEFRVTLVPCAGALFPLDLYDGEIVSDDPGDPDAPRYFTDDAQFRVLQAAGIESKLAELLADGWAFAETTAERWRYVRGAVKPEAGAVLVVTADLRRVDILTGVTRSVTRTGGAFPTTATTSLLEEGEASDDDENTEDEDENEDEDGADAAAEHALARWKRLNAALTIALTENPTYGLAAGIAHLLEYADEEDLLPLIPEAYAPAFKAYFDRPISANADSALALMMLFMEWAEADILALVRAVGIHQIALTTHWNTNELTVASAAVGRALELDAAEAEAEENA